MPHAIKVQLNRWWATGPTCGSRRPSRSGVSRTAVRLDCAANDVVVVRCALRAVRVTHLTGRAASSVGFSKACAKRSCKRISRRGVCGEVRLQDFF